MTELSVNLNAVAMLRNRRDIGWPSVMEVARLVLEAGADGITVHPRPDERHIRRSDVRELAVMLKAEFPKAEFNIEGFPDEVFLSLVEEVMPNQVTFVPDDPAQSTSDHGWAIGANEKFLKACIARMKAKNLRVALFVDDDPSVPPMAHEVGADRVELYTGPYVADFGNPVGVHHLQQLGLTAKAATEEGLKINAGHDLNLASLSEFLAAVEGVEEVSIGHAITSDALLMGFPEAVRRYKAVLE